MLGTMTDGSRRKRFLGKTMLLVMLAGALLLSACEGGGGKGTDPEPQAVVRQEGQPDAGPPAGSGAMDGGGILDAPFEEWDGELQCGNRTLKPGGPFTVSMEDEKAACLIHLKHDRAANLTLQDLNALAESWFTGYWSAESIGRMESWRHQLAVRSRQSGAIELELHFSSDEIGTYELKFIDPSEPRICFTCRPAS